jgi:hypothetical protein
VLERQGREQRHQRQVRREPEPEPEPALERWGACGGHACDDGALVLWLIERQSRHQSVSYIEENFQRTESVLQTLNIRKKRTVQL